MPNKHFVIERESETADGIEGNNSSIAPYISGDGRYVAAFGSKRHQSPSLQPPSRQRPSATGGRILVSDPA
ncbi:hypothetical protein [Microvirga aerophila]|uniref:hypothetical protein n=1 Tax=Microvirga aerophila TaxID=670291 RepID=UPI0011BD703B|nr:hypothetical protein [Microvirga aerophila]